MKIFFYGPYKNPGGPCEVNRNFVKCFDKTILTKDMDRKGISQLEALFKISQSDIVIFSGLMFRLSELKYAHLLRKKIIYIMHGCSRLETDKTNKKENEILKLSDTVLCVSNLYRDLMCNTFPMYKQKFKVLHNGIDWMALQKISSSDKHIPKEKNCIILFGGGRKLKHNLEVCRAVNELNHELNLNLKVDVYGYYRETDDSHAISKIPCVTFHHVIPHNQINHELAKSHIFIQNSSLESFGLALIDAIALGCDVLYSQHVGAKEIIAGSSEFDIIHDPKDVKEIKEKLKYLLTHSNNNRLFNSIDKESSSIKSSTDKLLSLCRNGK